MKSSRSDDQKRVLCDCKGECFLETDAQQRRSNGMATLQQQSCDPHGWVQLDKERLGRKGAWLECLGVHGVSQVRCFKKDL